MTLCEESNRKNRITLLIFAGLSVPTAGYILAEQGIAGISSALIGGLVVGGLGAGLYYGYQCNFDLAKCAESGVGSAACGIWTDITSIF